MSHTRTELFKRIPSGTLTDRLGRVYSKEALNVPNLTSEMFEKLEPVNKTVVLFGALVGAKVETLKVVLVKLVG
jgi:hypothetical protein